MLNDAWLEISGLHLKRGGREVLCDLSVSARGKALGLVGANGAGKTSLIGAMLGMLRPEKGTIRILELRVPEQSLDLKTRTGVMLEDAGIFPGGSGLEAVAFAGLLCGMSRTESLRRAHLCLDQLDVDEERFREIRSYSVGMKQRVKLAMSMIHEPHLLILDEPTVGLDHLGRSQFLKQIRKLRDQGIHLIFTTHILSDAEQICDEIMVIDDGRLSHFGAVDSLVDTSENSYVAQLTSGASRLAAELASVGFKVQKVEEDTVVFGLKSREDFHVFWESAKKTEAEVRQLNPAIKTLEDAVVEAMESRHG